MPRKEQKPSSSIEDGLKNTGAGMEFEKEYPESPVDEGIRPKSKALPKEDKTKRESVKKELDRTRNDPTSMQ